MCVPRVCLEDVGDIVQTKKISQETTPSPGVDSTDNDGGVVVVVLDHMNDNSSIMIMF